MLLGLKYTNITYSRPFGGFGVGLRSGVSAALSLEMSHSMEWLVLAIRPRTRRLARPRKIAGASCMNGGFHELRSTNVPLFTALWSLIDGIWGLLKGSGGVLDGPTIRADSDG